MYYYNFIDVSKIEYIKENEYFFYDNSFFLFTKIKKYNYNLIKNIEYLNVFHKIIKNRFNNYFSIYNNEQYALLKVLIKEKNRIISINDIITLSKNKVNYIIDKKNYYDLWIKKVVFLERYAKDYDLFKYDFNYFFGLSEIAINLVESVKYYNVTYGLSCDRFYTINRLYDLYNPFTIKYEAVVTSLAEYIKYNFFFNNKKEEIAIILNLNLSIDDIKIFVARLIFPTYYFDLFKYSNTKEKYMSIINKENDYILFLNEIINEIKKRYIEVSYLEKIINLL